jgi:hypothetical protein
MAETEKKPEPQREVRKARSSKMYGDGPRIEDKDVKAPVKKGGAPEPARTVSKGDGDMKHGGDTKGDVMAGTDGIPTEHHQHSSERTEAHHRRMREHADMHHRHEREHMLRVMGHHHEDHEKMSARHHEEMRSMHTRHEKEHREMADRHMGGGGPTDGIRDEGKKPDSAGEMK